MDNGAGGLTIIAMIPGTIFVFSTYETSFFYNSEFLWVFCTVTLYTLGMIGAIWLDMYLDKHWRNK